MEEKTFKNRIVQKFAVTLTWFFPSKNCMNLQEGVFVSKEKYLMPNLLLTPQGLFFCKKHNKLTS